MSWVGPRYRHGAVDNTRGVLTKGEDGEEKSRGGRRLLMTHDFWGTLIRLKSTPAFLQESWMRHGGVASFQGTNGREALEKQGRGTGTMTRRG